MAFRNRFELDRCAYDFAMYQIRPLPAIRLNIAAGAKFGKSIHTP